MSVLEQDVAQQVLKVTQSNKANYAANSEEGSTGNIVDMQGSISQNITQSQGFDSMQYQQFNKGSTEKSESSKLPDATTESEVTTLI